MPPCDRASGERHGSHGGAIPCHPGGVPADPGRRSSGDDHDPAIAPPRALDHRALRSPRAGALEVPVLTLPLIRPRSATRSGSTPSLVPTATSYPPRTTDEGGVT